MPVQDCDALASVCSCGVGAYSVRVCVMGVLRIRGGEAAASLTPLAAVVYKECAFNHYIWGR